MKYTKPEIGILEFKLIDIIETSGEEENPTDPTNPPKKENETDWG